MAAQAERKANSTRAASTECCDRTLLRRTKELLDAADIGKLRPGWDGPFTVTACPSPKAAPLALTRGKMCCSPTVNVDRLKPFFARAGTPPAPGQVSDAGQEGEHEAELLLNRRMVRGVTRWLTRLPLIFNWRPGLIWRLLLVRRRLLLLFRATSGGWQSDDVMPDLDASSRRKQNQRQSGGLFALLAQALFTAP